MRLCVNNSLLQKYNTFSEPPNIFIIFNKPIASARSHFLLGSGPKIKYQRYFSSGPDPGTKKKFQKSLEVLKTFHIFATES